MQGYKHKNINKWGRIKIDTKIKILVFDKYNNLDKPSSNLINKRERKHKYIRCQMTSEK